MIDDKQRVNIIKALWLIDQLGESRLPEKIHSNKVTLLDFTTIGTVNSSFFETLFSNRIAAISTGNKKENRHEKTEDLVFPVFFGSYQGQKLRDLIKSDDDTETVEIDKSQNFSAMMLFDQNFDVVEGTTFVPANTVLLHNIDDITDNMKDLEQKLDTTYQDFIDVKLSFVEKLQKINKLIQTNFSLATDEMHYTLPVHKNEVTTLHSFFTNDIESILSGGSEHYGNVKRYIDGFDVQKRVDLEWDDKSIYSDILNPDQFPDGRWPAKSEYALSLMQQVAVNLAINDKNDIRSVNGPPGTGKTTLLKDIFADMMVKQSEQLAKLADPKNAIIKGEHFAWDQENPQFHIDYHLAPELMGYGIVVASSNNAAVENISKELPKLPDLFSGEYATDYFNEAYSKRYGKTSPDDTWGFFSAPGGNATNRDTLMSGLQDMIDLASETETIGDWDRTREQFLATLQEVRSIKQRTAEYANDSQSYDHANYLMRTNGYTNELEASKKELLVLRKNLIDSEQETEKIDNKISLLNNQIKNELAAKPVGFLMSKKRREQVKETRAYIGQLNADIRDLIVKKNVADGKRKQINMFVQEIEQKIDLLKEKITYREANALKLKLKYDNAISYFKTLKNVKVLDSEFWNSTPIEQIQRSTLWFDDRFRELQARVFVEAMKVRKLAIIHIIRDKKNNPFVHVLNQTWPKKQLIATQNPSVINHSWGIIQFLVPVISSTFASFGAFFGAMGEGSIDNLFIDEAGQALPVQALGAFWRSKRVMAVGDPSQIAPVQLTEESMLNQIKNYYNIETDIFTNPKSSIQALADRASQFGANLEKGWVGIPLWVHRRCLEPMFSISNAIAYHNKMVQGIDNDHEVGASYWFDVKGNATDQQFVPEHRKWLEAAIQQRLLISRKGTVENNEAAKKATSITLDDIYVISPFQIVAEKMSHIKKPIGVTEDEFKLWQENNVGTVHKFQGKEAKAVFLVLGADENSTGSITWATQEPNLLNVAVTRARKEFYVIGDKAAFGNFKHLDVVVKHMLCPVSPVWQLVQSRMVNINSEISIHRTAYWAKGKQHRIYVNFIGALQNKKVFYDLDQMVWHVDDDLPLTGQQIEAAVLGFNHVNSMRELDER